jgi:transposase
LVTTQPPKKSWQKKYESVLFATMNIQMPTHNEIHATFSKGKESIVVLFDDVGKIVIELASQLETQNEVIKELQARLSKDSSNSSKPPSSDGYVKKTRRTESLRKPGKKPNGGQAGHKGHTLKATDSPDQTVFHEAKHCEQCQTSLEKIQATACQERQIFDIPAIRIFVPAHQAEIKICPECGHKNKGQFPEDINQTVQYGDGIGAWAGCFSDRHFIPVGRTAQIFGDLLNHRVCEATVLKASEEKNCQSVFPQPRKLSKNRYRNLMY